MAEIWLKLLKQNLEAKGPKKVSEEIGYSTATLNLCKNGKYAKTKAVAARVMALYGNNGKVECPVLGDITPQKCADHHGHAKTVGLRVGNPDTMRLHKTCLQCPVRGGQANDDR